MTLTDSLRIALAGITGFALGAFFFGGLCWTVRRAVGSPRPALWLFGSVLARMAITLGGFYLVAQSGGASLLVCLAGFVVARIVVFRLTRPPSGVPHAP